MLKKRERGVVFRFAVFLSIMSLLFIFYFYIKEQLERQFGIIEDDFLWVYQIDAVEVKGEDLVIEGWAFEQRKDSEKNAYEIIICDMQTGKGYYPQMQYKERKDVNEYFLCEYDYLESGFNAKISVKKLNLETGMYEILLRPIGNHNAYSTGTYFFEGKKMLVNPQKYVSLKTQGTDLETITQDGFVLLYLPEVGMYVYQYNDKLFWIADENYDVIDENTTISYRLTTSQLDKLPERDIKGKRDWAYLDFEFLSKEIHDWNTGQYRVAVCEIPESFAITNAWTGEMDLSDYSWKWLNFFRPIYEFE